MRFRGLAIACLVLLTLSVGLFWSGRHKPSKAAATAAKGPVILKVDPANVTAVTIRSKDEGTLTLKKQDTEKWQIDAPKKLPADQDVVTGLLSNLSPLTAERVIENRATNLKNFWLYQPALELDITARNRAEQKLLLGDDTPTGDSAYAMLAGDPRIFTVFRFNKTELDKGLNDLRDKRLITVDPEKVSRIELIRNGQDMEFGRNADNWQILKPGPYREDLSAADGLLYALTGARMNLTGTGSQDADREFSEGTPVAIAKITGEAGTQTLELRKNKDNYFAKSSIVDGSYLVDTSLADAVNKDLYYFRNKTVFDFSYNEPNKVDLQISGAKSGAGSQSWYLVRSGNDWWLDGKKMDADSVESLVSSLRALTASKFVTAGFTTPQIIATVTSGNGKHVEKVMIAKSGADYLAKREDDPTLYVVDAGAVEGIQSAANKIKPAAASHK